MWWSCVSKKAERKSASPFQKSFLKSCYNSRLCHKFAQNRPEQVILSNSKTHWKSRWNSLSLDHKSSWHLDKWKYTDLNDSNLKNPIFLCLVHIIWCSLHAALLSTFDLEEVISNHVAHDTRNTEIWKSMREDQPFVASSAYLKGEIRQNWAMVRK